MRIKIQFKHIFMLFGLVSLMGWSTAQAQTIGVIRQDSNDRTSPVRRSTDRSTETNRSTYRSSQVDRSSSGYRGPDYRLRYEDKHFGFQIGTSPCYYDCDNYGRRPPYYNGYPAHRPGNGWYHRPSPQQSYLRPYYKPRPPGVLDPLP